MTMDEWMGYATPTPRSLAETAELAFREEDQRLAQERRRSEELVATRRTDREDLAAVHQFLGHPTRTHAEVLAGFAVAADLADQWEGYRNQQAERKREAGRQQYTADLEEAVAETSTRAEQLGKNFHQAVEGWGRAREEAASFRDAAYR